MKCFIFLLAGVFLVFSIQGQVPESFNYQVIPRDAGNNVYPDQEMYLRFSIIPGSPTGTADYVETFTKTTTSLGLINLQIGTGTPASGTFSGIDWSSGTFYLKVEIDVDGSNGGTIYTDMGTTRLISVPYAMFAKKSADAFSGSYDDLAGKPTKIGDFSGDMNSKVITNLAEPSLEKDASTKGYVDKLGKDMEHVALVTGGLAKDYDGNIYKTLKAGNQEWLLSSLRTTHFNNGDAIPTTPDINTNISSESTPVYQWAPDGDNNLIEEYGRLYTWYAITDPRGICPTGWHVSSNYEWEVLVDYLGGEGVAGAKIREEGTSHWIEGNIGTNSSGFTALPAGFRAPEGPFYWLGEGVYFGTSTETSVSEYYRPATHYDWDWIDMGSSTSKKCGLSVRCVRNNELDKTFDGTVTLNGIKLAAGSGPGKLLTSDASGMGSWQLPAGTVPVGAIVAWLKGFSGTPSLPSSFAECNGQTVNDSESPFNGQVLPDLNNKFLLGSTTSGSTGGSASHSHSGATALVSTAFPATNGMGAPTISNMVPMDHTHNLSIPSASSMPPFYTVVWIIRIK